MEKKTPNILKHISSVPVESTACQLTQYGRQSFEGVHREPKKKR